MSMVKGLKEEKNEVTAQRSPDGDARMGGGERGLRAGSPSKSPRHSLVLSPPVSVKPSPVAPALTNLCPLIMEHLLFDE